MLFVESMVVPRAGRAVPDFTVEGDAALIRAPHTLCEFLHGSCQTKLFLDRDAYIDAFDASVVESEKRDVVARCDEIVSMLRTPDTDVRYVLASRHGAVKGRYKVSFRAFFSGFSVVYHDIPVLIRFMEQEQFWDTSPYKRSEQLLAAIHGHKSASDPRVLAPELEFADRDVEEFLAQVVSGPFLDLDAFDKRDVAPPNANADAGQDGPTASPEYVRGLVALLSPRRATDRKTWVDVGLALKNAGGGTDEFLDAFRDFSQRATDPAKVSSDRDIRRTWGSFRDACANPLTVKSLAHWARTDNPEAYRRLKPCTLQPMGTPLSLQSVLSVMGNLAPDRTDLATVRLALRLNDKLLRNASRPREAEAMGWLYEAFACAHRDSAPDNRAEYDAAPEFGDTSAMDKLCKEAAAAAREDDAGAQLKALIARHVGVAPDAIGLEELANNRVRFVVGAERGHIDLKDMAILFRKEWSWVLAGEDGTRFYHEEFKDLARRYFDHDVDGLRYFRHSETQASLEGDQEYPQVTMTFPYTRRSVVMFKEREDEDEEPRVLADVEGFNNDLRDVIRKASISALGESVYNNILNYGTFQQNITINNSVEDPSSNRIVRLQNRLLAHASANNLRKLNGYVYTPLAGRPCAFVPGLEYEAFVSAHFGQEEELRQSVDSVKKLATFLTDFKNLDDFPELVPDLHVISFANGVLNIATLEFTPYDEIGDTKTIARHHIDLPYEASCDTPALDVVLDHQFNPDVKRWLLGLIGRMLFHVRERDRWEIALFLFGVAGAGKSLVLQLIQGLFRQDAVANFAAEKDGHFALEGLLGAEVVVGSDMPSDISKAIDGTELQKMCSGEPVVVNQKGKKQIRIPRWTSPLIFASNYEPSWKNSQDCIGRRLVPFRFANVVHQRDPMLGDRLAKELPNFCCRILTEYHALVREFGNKDITQCFPPDIKEWSGEVRASSSKLYEFLSMDEDERVVSFNGECVQLYVHEKASRLIGEYVVKIEKCPTGGPALLINGNGFAAIFNAWRKRKEFVCDGVTFAAKDFQNPKKKWVCKSCGALYSVSCCKDTDRDNGRIQKICVDNMRVTLCGPIPTAP